MRRWTSNRHIRIKLKTKQKNNSSGYFALYFIGSIVVFLVTMILFLPELIFNNFGFFPHAETIESSFHHHYHDNMHILTLLVSMWTWLIWLNVQLLVLHHWFAMDINKKTEQYLTYYTSIVLSRHESVYLWCLTISISPVTEHILFAF